MTDTFAITEYSGDRRPRHVLPYQGPAEISMQSLALVALIISAGAVAEQISICRRSSTMAYDVVAEFAEPGHVQLMHSMIGGVIRQAFAPYDVNVPAQVVNVWSEGNHCGVEYRFESSYTVARAE